MAEPKEACLLRKYFMKVDTLAYFATIKSKDWKIFIAFVPGASVSIKGLFTRKPDFALSLQVHKS
jgi:hypothetical protein